MEEEKKKFVEKESEFCLQLKSLQCEIEKLTTEIELHVKQNFEIEFKLNSSEDANQVLRQQIDKNEEEKRSLNNDLLAKGFDERKLQAENNDLTEKLLNLTEKLAMLDADFKKADETIQKLKQQVLCDEEKIHILNNNIQAIEYCEEKLKIENSDLVEQVNKLIFGFKEHYN